MVPAVVVTVVVMGFVDAAWAGGCDGARGPTRAVAWRAHVPVLTPLRPRLASPAAHARVTLVDRWLLVVRARTGRGGACMLQVRLATRPNGADGWVARSRVRLARTRWRIEISRSARSLTLRHAGRRAARYRVVVGKPSTPTPAGVFAVQETWRSPAGSFAGAWILTLTAHSDVLATFDGGDGLTALHGRGGASLADPLGSAASHGCVRLDNRAIGAIVRRVGRARLPGVPVVIA